VNERIRNCWPVVLCVFAYYISVAWIACSSVKTTGGELIYPLDDTYIHLSIAKSFSQYGVWGYTRYAFSSTTSSPLYTGLLAAGNFVFGQTPLLPLAINLLFGTILIGYLYEQFHQELHTLVAAPLLLGTCFAISIPALTLLGMEHLLHMLLTIIFVCVGSTALVKKVETPQNNRTLLLIAALLPLTRYEGCFAVAGLSGCLFLQKRFRFTLTLAIAGILPISLYGLACHMHGWFFLPNSILLKGITPHFSSVMSILNAFGLTAVRSLFKNLVLLLLFFLGILTCHLLWITAPDKASLGWWRGAMFLGVLFAHLQFAQTGWLYRYEAYLVGLGLIAIVPSFVRITLNSVPTKFRTLSGAVSILGMAILASPFAARSYTTLANTQKAMHDRYLEHIQPSRFLKEYFPDATVVVNDIGAVAYFTDCHLLDMYGLGNIEPMRFRKSESGYTKAQVDEWTRSEDAVIALLQVQWDAIHPRIPDSWIKVAEWEVPRNVVFGDLRIGWFAIKQELASVLAADLLVFKDQMPPDIKVTMMMESPNKPDARDGL